MTSTISHALRDITNYSFGVNDSPVKRYTKKGWRHDPYAMCTPPSSVNTSFFEGAPDFDFMHAEAHAAFAHTCSVDYTCYDTYENQCYESYETCDENAYLPNIVNPCASADPCVSATLGRQMSCAPPSLRRQVNTSLPSTVSDANTSISSVSSARAPVLPVRCSRGVTLPAPRSFQCHAPEVLVSARPTPPRVAPRIFVVEHRCRVVEYNARSVEAAIGDFVIVEGDRGVDMGRLVRVEPLDQNNHKPRQSVLRIATESECATYETQTTEIASKILPLVRNTIATKFADNADISSITLVGCDLQFDREKLFVFYDAKGFISFLPLAEQLFHSFRCRIWMHQLDRTATTKPTTSSILKLARSKRNARNRTLQ